MSNRNSYLAPATAIELSGSSEVLFPGPCVFMGLSIIDEASGQIKVQVYDGLDDTGVHLLQLTVNAGGNAYDWFGPNGVKCDTGLYLKVYAGTPSGSAFIR